MTEKEKMLSGAVYNAADDDLVGERQKTKLCLKQYNSLSPDDADAMDSIIRQLLGGCGVNVAIVQPFYCDYGAQIVVGENFFANYNLTILDEAMVTIGDNVFIGPNVGIYTACHPIDAKERRTLVEWAKPVTIGNDVWIGGGVTICPGVMVGDNVVIGAGSVVVKDIPSNSVAVGNPARVIKHLCDDKPNL